MYTRLLEAPGHSFFLFGPRGTGKTTWLRQRLGSALWFDLLDQTLFFNLIRNPAMLRQAVLAAPSGSWVVLDEVQKLPGLLDEVHRILAEPAEPYRFALCGSSARKLKHGGANLLAGRAINRAFFPLVGAEMDYAFDLDELLSYGALPKIRSELAIAVDILEAYTSNYIRQEIQQEALVRDIGTFTRFLDVAALMNGQMLNISKVARDCGVARPTVQRYFEILDDTLIAFRLPAWRPGARVKEVGAAKFYLFDPGVARALAGRVRLPLTDFERGPLLETLVLHELRAWINQSGCGGSLSYWRTPHGAEVDFVWTLGERAVCIEVKAATRWRPEDGKYLRDMLERGLVAKAFGIYRGELELKDGGAWVLPVKAFMERLQAGELIG